MSDKIKVMLDRVKQQLAADKKKAAILGGLFLVLLVAVGQLFISDSVPQTVQAESIAIPLAASPPVDPVVPTMRPVPERLDVPPIQPSRERVASSHRASWSGAEKRITTPDNAAATEGMLRDFQRDPFSTADWSLFMPPTPKIAALVDMPVKPARQGPSFWSKLQKAVAAQGRELEKGRHQFELDLAALTLQSTMTGSAPSAYISGRLVHEGDTICGFSVVTIQDRRVMLRQSGLTGELILP